MCRCWRAEPERLMSVSHQPPPAHRRRKLASNSVPKLEGRRACPHRRLCARFQPAWIGNWDFFFKAHRKMMLPHASSPCASICRLTAWFICLLSSYECHNCIKAPIIAWILLILCHLCGSIAGVLFNYFQLSVPTVGVFAYVCLWLLKENKTSWTDYQPINSHAHFKWFEF